MLTSPRRLTCAAASVILLFTSVLVLRAADDLPNIVLVMADDQGWGDMAYNGHPHLKTPNFDAMAKEGVRFDNFHAAAPVCSPTRGSVLTGRTPNRYGVFQWGWPLRPQEITLAEALKPADYRSGHFGKWHLGSVRKDQPTNPGAQGFDAWVSSPNYFDLDPILSDRGKATQFHGDSSDITADLAIRFIKESVEKEQRFLAVVWFGSPHNPHKALEADRAPYADLPNNLQQFYGEITAMDRAFGRIRDTLRDLGLRKNTVLWYCSDNGALPKLGSTGGRRGNKGTVYEGGLAVPALLEWPAKFPEPKVITAPCVTSDIFPTLMDIAGHEPDKSRPLDGISLMPLLEGEAKKRNQPIGFWDSPLRGIGTPAKQWMEEQMTAEKEGREPAPEPRAFAEAAQIKEHFPPQKFPGHSAWVDGNWKLHRIEHPKSGTVNWELYDLANDPAESRVLLAEQPDRVPQMQAALERWLESVVQSLNGRDYGPEKKP
jgi:arylsulfatase A-like enzyme